MDSAEVPQNDYQQYVPFVKVDAAKREVYGIITAEVEDKTGETCHYDSTKQEYKAWSGEFLKATDGKSCGNLREMHQLRAVGKGIDLAFNDAGKEISMGFKVVDDDAWKKVEEGVYTGFSQGGAYLRQWKADGKKYYTARPSEVSLVDNPALGVCHFAYVRADGAVEMRKVRTEALPGQEAAGTATATNAELPKLFSRMTPEQVAAEDLRRLLEHPAAFLKALGQDEYGRQLNDLLKQAKTKRVDGVDLSAHSFAYVSDARDTSTWKLPIEFPNDKEKTESHIRNALARFNHTEGIPAGEKSKVLGRIRSAAKKHGIETSADKCAASLAQVEAALAEVQKGMFQVSQFAELLERLRWLQNTSEIEASVEGDESPVPGNLLARLKELCIVFLAMAEEEVSELTAAGDSDGANSIAFAATDALHKTSLLLNRAAEKLSNTKDAGTPAEGNNVSTDNNNTGTDLSKAAGVLQHLKKAKELAKSHSDAMCSHMDKCMKSMGGDDDGDGDGDKASKAAAAAANTTAATTSVAATAQQDAAKSDASADLAKAMNEQFQGVLTGMQAQFKSFMEELGKTLEAPKAAQSNAGRVVTKTQDNQGADNDAEQTADPVFRAQGPPSLAVSDAYRKAMSSVRGAPITD